MIPIVLFRNYPEILQFFILIIRWLNILRNRRRGRINQFQQILQLMHSFLQLAFQWLNILLLISRWLQISQRKKRRLFKPHLLLHVLGGFR